MRWCAPGSLRCSTPSDGAAALACHELKPDTVLMAGRVYMKNAIKYLQHAERG